MGPDVLVHDRYRLVARLGAGGMAEVWRAQDTHLERPVAIKFLAEGLRDDPENLVRLFSEAQSIARLQHPNVVDVLDFGEHEGHPYIVMEFVSGGPLTQVCGAPLLPERALEIVAAVAAGAGAAHRLGIVHRDIKPGNILLDDVGEPRLADFGIASSAGAERMTQTGHALGSPHYLSPEQAQGRELGPPSDVYSLGVVLYELLTGVRPFEGENITAVAIAHVEKEPQPPSAHAPDLSPGLDALVLRCLAKDPAHRFPDGASLATAIRSGWWQTLEPEDLEETPRFPVRALLGAVAAMLIVVAALATALFAATGPAPADAAGAASPSRGPGATAPAAPTPARSAAPAPLAAPEAPEASPTPTPTPSEREEEADEREERKTSGAEPEPDPTPEPSPEPEPEPEPEPSPELEPTPQPT